MDVRALINEEVLLAKLAEDDASAFTTIFHHYRDRIYTVALRLSRSESLAEEVVQDVFIKVWLKRAELPGLENFQGWLFIVARNQLFSVLRYQARHPTAGLDPDEHFPISAATADNPLTEKEYQQLLTSALAALSPAQREVYRLVREEGMKRDQVAALLGVSVNTVKTHLQRAMTGIRTYCLSRLPAAIALLLLQAWK